MLYDAVQAAESAGQLGLHLCLRIGGQQLAPLCHNAIQRRVLALPGRDVSYVPGSITPQQVATHRPSYVNALLIQRAGVLIPGGCNRCRNSAGFRPFPECRFVRGEFGNACGNCKWRDHAARCLHGHGGDADDGGDPGNDDDDVVEIPRLPAPRQQLLLPYGAPGSASNPLSV